MTQKLLQKLCALQSISIPVIEDSANKLISKLQFSGNVRELENMLERALALCDGEKICADDLFMDQETALKYEDAISLDINKPQDVSLSDYLEDIEKSAILKALAKTNNNKTAAAKLLGVSFRTLRYRLNKLGLAKDEDADLEAENE